MQTLQRKYVSRRGMTVILVLGLLAITLSLSYAMLRTQTTSARIQSNQNRRMDARQAAITGMQVALRRMHEASWAGVDVPLSGTLGTGVGYRVTFATGDATLTDGHSDRAKFPYRVTLTSIGKSIGSDGASASTHTVQTVVELVPRALSSEPANWASLQNHTVRQWKNAAAVIQPPLRIEGPVHLQGPISLCPDYPPDCRPFDGKIDEVGVFNRALSSLEVYNLALAAGTSPNLLLPTTYSTAAPSYWWRFNESAGTGLLSAAIGSISGLLQNGVTSGTSGLSGNATDFDGLNDFISVGKFDVSGDKLTLIAFFRPDSWNGSTDARLISKAVGTAEHETYWMLSTTQSGGAMRLRFRVHSGGTAKTLIASSGNLATGTWQMATAVYNGTDMILYLNGVEVGRTAKTGALATNPKAPVYLGDCPPGSPRTRYLRDLEAMRVAGMGDPRPLSGPLELPRTRTDANTLSMLEGELAVSTVDVAATVNAPLAHPGAVASYRLYPGGKSYSVTNLPNEYLATDLSPNVESNPLGVFHRTGRLAIGSGVSVQGTIITTGLNADVWIDGNNVRIAPAPLPSLYGNIIPVELPAVLATDDVRVQPNTGNNILGYVMAWDEFSWNQGDSNAACTLEGKLLCGALKLYGRTNWQAIAGTSWESWHQSFLDQLGGASPVAHFPTWVDDVQGYCYDPLLTIRPAASAVKYHWQDWTQPIYVAHSSDAGLVWKIIRWVDDP